jgi:acetyltransferase
MTFPLQRFDARLWRPREVLPSRVGIKGGASVAAVRRAALGARCASVNRHGAAGALVRPGVQPGGMASMIRGEARRAGWDGARAICGTSGMTIRNLHQALEPRSVALIGASEREGSLGRAVLANLEAGGYEGPIWPVNPKYTQLGRLPCYRSVAALPGAPELAVVAVPPRAVPGVIAALGARGTRLAVVTGLGRAYDGALRRRMLEAARPHVMRLIGPGSSGLMVPSLGLNAGLGETMARPGRLALVSQSGAIAGALVDWAAERGIGFSHVVSLGDMADVDVADYLDLLAGDRRTSAILLYLETLGAARKFMSAARGAARLKPVVAIKAGRHAEGAAAARLHTGTLVGADVVAEAAFARAGVLRVVGLAELFEAAEVMGRLKPLASGRLAIVTNGGGAGVLAVDRMMDIGGVLAAPAAETLAGLDGAMPAGWSRANPLDIDGDAGPERYLAALDALAADRGVDAALAMHCPTGMSDGDAVARALAEAVRAGRFGRMPVLACWLGGARARAGRASLREAGVATFDAPAAAAAAMAHLTDWGRAQAALLRVPDRGEAEGPTPDAARAEVAAILAAVADEGRRILLEPETNAVLGAYGVPVVETHVAPDPEAVAAITAILLPRAGAVAVKILSRDIVHKAEVEGVALDLADPQAAAAAARAMDARAAERRPEARRDGFIVQPMLRRALGEELIAGIGRDEVFGPVIVFGAGGIRVEAIGDTAVALPPLDGSLATELMGRSRVGRLLLGPPGAEPEPGLAAGPGAEPAAEGPGRAVKAVLVALSHLSEDFPCIRGLDINPLLADGSTAVVLDARLEIEPGEVGRPGPNPDFAVRPYPGAWTRRIDLKGTRFTLRAIRPTDAYLYPAFLARLDPEAIRMRFLAPRKHFPDEMGLRLSQLDYDRDMAFVAIDPEGALAGVARLAVEPERISAEYALIVRSDLGGRGLGSALMRHLIEYARAEGLARLEGAILRENEAMIGLVTRLGFVIGPDPDDRELVTSRLDL